MKKFPLWLVALPIVILAAALQFIYDLGERGNLHSAFLRDSVYPITRTVNGAFTNFKFRVRGPIPPKHKVVVVEVDDHSVDVLGRFPWHREIYAQLFHAIFRLGANQLALDVAFPEAEERIPSDVYKLIGPKNTLLAEQLRSFEGDPVLAKVVSVYKNQLILGFSPIATCQPGYVDFTKNHPDCPIENPDLKRTVSEDLDPFAIAESYPYPESTLMKTSLINIVTEFSNIPSIRNAAKYAGSFSISPDQDGYVRRYPLFFFRGNKIYLSLAMAAAQVARNDEVKIDFSEKTGLIERAYFKNDPGHSIPVTPLGNIDINFRGPAETFTYVRAIDVLEAYEKPNEDISSKLKDAYVFFGVSALGLYDMRAFPFDPNVPGVEGHTTAFDNLLSNDSLRSANNLGLGSLPIALIVVLGLLFSFLFSKFEAIPSLLVFIGFTLFFGLIDTQVLFARDINLPSAFLLIEILFIFALILAIRYILEEQNKKFVKEAFSKYLAPQVVDLVLKDPSKLTVGGERKELTILFSDLRGFTTFSEKMDPKTLSQFLNEYLSEMTEIVFEFEGTLDKYIGDAVMAFWGAPLHQDNHAELAWKAAVAMQKRIREINPVFKEKYGIEIGVGVGINSGVVSVGNMGSKRIFEYTVIGDHVNLASRLESLTRLYGCDILTTTNTLEAIPEAIRQTLSFRAIDSVIVKGKTQAVDLIQVSDLPLPKESVESFETAQRLFRSRAWDEAKTQYEQAARHYEQATGKNDTVAEIFIKRCEQFKIDPPDANWDGTIEMRRK